MATGIAGSPVGTRATPLPLASRRRPVFDRDSGAFLAARPPAAAPRAAAADPATSAPPVPVPAERPRVAATANLDTPDAPGRGLPARTARQDRRALALAFALGVGGPVAVLVLRALL